MDFYAAPANSMSAFAGDVDLLLDRFDDDGFEYGFEDAEIKISSAKTPVNSREKPDDPSSSSPVAPPAPIKPTKGGKIKRAGALDLGALEKALDAVVRDHGMSLSRYRFRSEADRAWRRQRPDAPTTGQFQSYIKDNIERVRGEMPGSSHTEVMRKIGMEWRAAKGVAGTKRKAEEPAEVVEDAPMAAFGL